MASNYRHSFADGVPGGWLGWHSNARGALPLEFAEGAAVSAGPWWIDYNHAPPGGGYLHILFGLHTSHPAGFSPQQLAAGGRNGFVDGRFPTDFRGARLHFTLKGEVDQQGARLVLLAQAKTGGIWVNYVLTGQPLEISREWSRQTVELTGDPSQWTCLGSRHDRRATYGEAPIGDVLADLNGNLILVLFPLDVRPVEAISEDDRHRLKAGEEYTADADFLPRGRVLLQSVEIEFSATLA